MAKGTHLAGLTHFCVREGEPFIEEISCGLCGEVCDVKRNSFGATSWAMAMGHGKVKHDLFTCPNIDEDWHMKALDIFRESLRTESPTLQEIYERDIAKLVKEKKNTL